MGFILFILKYFTYLFLYSPEDILINFPEREREGRETMMWERNMDQLPLQPRYVPWPGIEPAIPRFMGWCSNQLSHTGQGHLGFILSFIVKFCIL